MSPITEDNDDGDVFVDAELEEQVAPQPQQIGNNGEVDPESLANAEHLDNLESSGQFQDVASFQDIELPPPTHDDDATSVVETEDGSPTEDGARVRVKRFYYLRPLFYQYKWAVMGCTSIFIILLVAIGLSVKSLNSPPAYASGSDNVDTNDFIINDAPPPPGASPPGYDNNHFDYFNDDDEEDEEVGDPLEQDPELISQPPRPDPAPSNTTTWESIVHNIEDELTGETDDEAKEVEDWVEELQILLGDEDKKDETVSGLEAVLQEVEIAELADELEDALNNSEDGEGEGDIETGDPLENSPEIEVVQPNRPEEGSQELQRPPSGDGSPQWFQTTHEAYQEYLKFNAEENADIHSYDTAGLFCTSQNLQLCTYDVYCPNGQGTDPYPGGPPLPESHTFNTLEESQWAPYNSNSNMQESDWVQVGTTSESDGGDVDNNFGRCYNYNKWSNGMGDIVDVVSEDSRRWILCCEADDAVEGGV